jgi:hypothetical protein
MPSTSNKHDVILWPDGTWDYRCELVGGDTDFVDSMRGDYEVIEYGTGRWYEITDSVPYADF